MLNGDSAFIKAEEVQYITPFYQYLFEVMRPFDSTYEVEKMQQIESQIIKATK